MADPQNIQRLMGLFERKNDDGTYYYSDEDVRNFLPLLVLTVTLETGKLDWPEATTKMMDEFIGKLGLGAEATPQQLQEAIDAHYAKQPVNEEFKAQFQGLVRELIASGSSQELSDAASKLLGVEQRGLAPKDPNAKGKSLFNMMLSGGSEEE